MARLLGPDPGSRAVFLPSGAPAVGRTAVLYTDEAATTPADIRVYDGTGTPGAAYPGGAVTVDGYGLLPRVWFPDGLVDRLYARVAGGPATAVPAANEVFFDGITFVRDWA